MDENVNDNMLCSVKISNWSIIGINTHVKNR